MELKFSDLTFVLGGHRTGKTRMLSEVFANRKSVVWVRDDGMVISKGVEVPAMIDSPDYMRLWDKWESTLGWQSRAYRVIEPILRAGYSLPEGSTLILEHPDAFLDRAARTDLVDFLCDLVSAGKQVIIETHDDLCFFRACVLVRIETLHPEQVAVNYMTLYDVYYPRIDKDGHIQDCPDGFLEETNAQLWELL